jgi:hypothetical protein
LEELKNQLGDSGLAGALPAMAEAAGFGTNDDAVAKLMDAMKKGEVKSKDVMEKFAKILFGRVEGSLTDAMKTTAAQQGRMKHAFSQFVEHLSAGGFDEAMANTFKNITDGLMNNEGAAKALGRAFQILLTPFNAAVSLISDLGSKALPALAKQFGISEGAVLAIGTGIGMMMFPMTRAITMFGLLVTAAEDLWSFFQGKDSMIGNWLGDDKDVLAQVEGLKNAFLSLGQDSSSGANSFVSAMKSIGDYLNSKEFKTGALVAVTEMVNLFGDLGRGIYNLGTIGGNIAGAIADPNSAVPITYGLKQFKSQTVNGFDSLYTSLGNDVDEQGMMESAQREFWRRNKYNLNITSPSQKPTVFFTFDNSLPDYSNPNIAKSYAGRVASFEARKAAKSSEVNVNQINVTLPSVTNGQQFADELNKGLGGNILIVPTQQGEKRQR